MPWYVAAYELLLNVSLASCALLAVAIVAVSLLREPVRKSRVIELTMRGLLALSLLVLFPGYPRVALLLAEVQVEREVAELPRVREPRADESGTSESVLVSNVKTPSALPVWAAATDSVIIELPTPSSDPIAAPATQTPENTEAASFVAGSHKNISQLAPQPARSLNAQVPTDVRSWIVVIYLTGVALMLGYALLGMLAIVRLVRIARMADHNLQRVLHEIIGCQAHVRLLISSRVVQPCAFGSLRPTIVLLERLIQTGDARQIRFALAHEWSHVSRGDLRAWLLSSIARLRRIPDRHFANRRTHATSCQPRDCRPPFRPAQESPYAGGK